MTKKTEQKFQSALRAYLRLVVMNLKETSSITVGLSPGIINFMNTNAA